MPPFQLPQGTLLLAVSGGRDSVVLLHLVANAGVNFAVAHCNFHLRPGDCDSDELFVRQLADACHVPCHVAQFNTNAYATAQHLSVEEAARNLRYDFFRSLCQQYHYDYILTAHHRDDSIETFFINLLRGTGIAGLHGIRYLNGNICRPLLQWSRADINAYVAQHQLAYVEDSTNASLLYRRNQIRHQLLPLLRQLDSHFDLSMQSTMEHLADVEQVLLSTVASIRHSIVHTLQGGGEYIALQDIASLNPLQTLLYHLLKPYGVNAAMVQDIIASLNAQSGKQFHTPTHLIIRDRTHLLIVPNHFKETEAAGNKEDIKKEVSLSTKGIDFPKEFGAAEDLPEIVFSTLPLSAVSDYRSTATVAYFDADKVQMPLALRHWRHADRFHPYGMKGSKLLSDYFTDLKLSLLDKQRQLLLVDATDTILWVVSRRTASPSAITSATTHLLKVEIRS